MLNWDHSLGNASVIGNFKEGKKELLVSLYQAIVLLEFNEISGGIRYNEIKMGTSMGEFRFGSKSVVGAMVNLQPIWI